MSVTWEGNDAGDTREYVTRPCPAPGCEQGMVTKLWDFMEDGQHHQSICQVRCTLCLGKGVLIMPKDEADQIIATLVDAFEAMDDVGKAMGGRYDA